MVHLVVRMYCNWPTDHAIDHSSIGLNRLTIQLVFNEVSLFTFSKGTHGFDVMVPKNYLKHDTLTAFIIVQLCLLCNVEKFITITFFLNSPFLVKFEGKIFHSEVLHSVLTVKQLKNKGCLGNYTICRAIPSHNCIKNLQALSEDLFQVCNINNYCT